eukprot:scaffold176756_cov33-Tisochrysis_lutea.AAC.3
MAALGVEDERSYSFLVWVLAGLENVLWCVAQMAMLAARHGSRFRALAAAAHVAWVNVFGMTPKPFFISGWVYLAFAFYHTAAFMLCFFHVLHADLYGFDKRINTFWPRAWLFTLAVSLRSQVHVQLHPCSLLPDRHPWERALVPITGGANAAAQAHQ